MNIKIIIFWSLLFISNVSFAQENGFVVPDSLKGKSFEELKKSILQNAKKTDISKMIAFIYIHKAKKDKDTLEIVHGYHFLSYFIFGNEKLKYIDSIIFLTKNKNYPSYPMKGFLEKGNFYYNKRMFSNALDNYLKGRNLSVINKNRYLINIFNHKIGIIKSRIGDNESAINLFESCKLFFESNKTKYRNEYISTLFALSGALNSNKSYKYSTIINKLGYKESIELGLDNMKFYFILIEGINQFSMGNIEEAQDSLTKTSPHFKQDIPNQIINNYYLGKTLRTLNEIDESVVYFKKNDSLFDIIKDIHPDTRKSYIYLIEYYKSKKDFINQLKYTEKLLVVDSIIYNNFKNLNLKISSKYDKPKLLEDKNKMIHLLNNKSKSYLYYLLLFVTFSLIILTLYLRKQYKYKRVYLKLIAKNEKILENNDKKNVVLKKEISMNQANLILDKLDTFEKEEGFLEIKLTQTKLANKLNTNSTYLSNVINSYKKQNFSNYLNDLRIEYALNALQKDKKIRKYTIKALAEEFGYNNSESFSKAFYKKTGIKPSYFIKQIEKQLN